MQCPSCRRQHNRLLHSNLPKKETVKNVSDATWAVATNITQGRLPVVRIKLTNRDLSLNVLAMCDSGSSIPFVDKSVVSKLQFQGRKASLSVAGIHGSQDVKTELVPIAVSAHEKSRPLTTVQFYVHEKLKLGHQIVELQELNDRYPHLRNLPNQVDQAELNETKDKQPWYLPHHPVINPHKPEKVGRVSNAAAKYQGVALNDKLLSGPDLLHSLIRIIFRFRTYTK